MELIKNFLCTIAVLVVAYLSLIDAQDACVKVNSCKCMFSNGSGIDLSPSASAAKLQSFKTTYFRTSATWYELSTYFYYPCVDIDLNIETKANNTCNKPLAICRHVNNLTLSTATPPSYIADVGRYDYLGSSNLTTFSADGHTLTYNHASSQTTVKLVCAEADDKLYVVSLDEPNDLELAFYSRNACLKQLEEPGRSTGSTLCVIFFSVVLLYFVLGICTKKFLMGATGVEVVPNLSFWTDLPNLVKEGWAFALNGFRLPARGPPAASPDPNSYDSI